MIGIYDSGIGGLGIFKKIRSILPQESISYFADSTYFPFGDRPPEEVRDITLHGLQQLAKTCNIVVLACNTASVTDIAYYRQHVSVPVIAVVPVIKTAAHVTETNHVALLATVATANSVYTDDLIQKFAEDVHVEKISCSGLADAIEHDDTEKQQNLLNQIMRTLPTDIDVIILGCTHYTLIKGLIQNIAGPDVKILDSNTAVARHVLRIMRKEKLERPQNQPEYLFNCSGEKSTFFEQVKKYTGIVLK